MTWPSPGIYPDVTNAEYFGLRSIDGRIVRSNSTLQAFDRDPALFHAGHEKATTTAMRRGSIFDCLLTSPHRFATDFAICDFSDFRTAAAREWRDAQTKIIVMRDELESAVARIKAIQSDERWQAMTAGTPQFQIGLRADIEGVPFKGLIDLLPDETESEFGDAIVDVKFSGLMDSLDDVLRTCRKLRYNFAGGLYRGLARMNGLNRNRYVLFIVPATGPVTPCVLELGEMMLANGANTLLAMSRRMSECEMTGHWPGRFDGVKQVEQADETWSWTEVLPELQEA